MIKPLKFTGNMCYIYLTKTIIQLLKIKPKETNFILTVINNILYITKCSDEKLIEENTCIKKARKVGSGYGIFLTKSLLEILDINPSVDMVDISVNNETLIVKKA